MGGYLLSSSYPLEVWRIVLRQPEENEKMATL